jgi:two-component system sensor histidine kinase VanS
MKPLLAHRERRSRRVRKLPPLDQTGKTLPPRRFTARARLTLLYAGLVTASGMAILGLIYGFMRFVPTFVFDADFEKAPASPPAGSAQISPDSGSSTDGITLTPTTSDLNISSTHQMLHVLLLVSAALVFVLAVAGVGVGWWIAGRVLRPLASINTAARLAADGSLEHRIALGGPRDEFTDLSDTFDEMLDRLHEAFKARERFAANASHELQTPLATTKTMIDVALRHPASTVDSLRGVLLRLNDTNQRSIDTVQALLQLAVSQEGQARGDENLDLAEIAAQALATVTPTAAIGEPAITARLAPAPAAGDPVLLQRMTTNLLANAVKYNVPQGTINVTTDVTDGQPRLVVENTGPTISPSRVTSLTEPFVRGQGRTQGRAGPSQGHGLGLAIVASIVQAHDATLQLEARTGGGLIVTITFPPTRHAGSDSTPARSRSN